MTQSIEFLLGFQKGLDVVSDAIKQTTYGGQGEEALQNMLNGIIYAIHHNQNLVNEQMEGVAEIQQLKEFQEGLQQLLSSGIAHLSILKGGKQL